MRALGLDVGERRIGVALSDAEGILAVALTVIETKSDDDALRQIIALAHEHEVERIVVGLPLSLDGSLGPQAQKVRLFTESLEGCTELPVVAWDERYSTADAERVLVEAGVRRDKRKKRIDSVAAAFILQGYLDRERSDK
ncbi:MAG: Holliday junction resolvase RuvX [Dehalococcoidia bacterium]|nr:Holliday junction resolvase RuvX [Dehalococcoidia bacterium]